MKMSRIITISYNEPCPVGYLEINCTSRSTTKYRALSPFLRCDLDLYDGLVAKNVENAWQFSKVYREHETNGMPNDKWIRWRNNGFSSEHAYRYPMGKDARPLYTYYNGMKHSYVEARKEVYFPLYIESMRNNQVFHELKELFELGEQPIAIRDFDVYRIDKSKIPLAEVVDNPHKKCGHGFVLYHLLTEEPYKSTI